MAPLYELWIYNRAGVLQRQVTDFLRLEYVKERNAVGLCSFDLRASHSAIAYLEADGFIEVLREDSDAGIARYVDFGGFYVDDWQRSADSDGNTSFRANCPDYNDLLAREIVDWSANTANRSTFSAVAAETIAKTLVTYNIGASATVANGRRRTSDLTGKTITVQADAAAGTVQTLSCAWQNLLTTLQGVAKTGGGDFAIVRGTGAAWDFRWYPGQLGTDRSATIKFSLVYDNMESPSLTRNRLREKTVAAVGGQGQEDQRLLVTRTGTNYNATYHSRVSFVQASQSTTTAGLNQAGDARLSEMEARDELNFGIKQTAARRYGRDYFHGDLVEGYYEGITATKQIVKTIVTVTGGGTQMESIRAETSNA